MTENELLELVKVDFKHRKFSAGLLIAYVDMCKSLNTPESKFKNFEDFLKIYPALDERSPGKKANTLIVKYKDKHVSLRPFYNAIENYFRAEMKRFDYPNCAPHATQAWTQYINWFDEIASYSMKKLDCIRELIVKFVLDTLENQEFDPNSVRVDPPLFQYLLKEFELTAQPGEPTGATLQGIVFGFLRADNPHLQIEIDKVRTGSKRLQRISDIDCWDGARLAISAEVKQYTISESDIAQFQSFGNDVGKRGALGIVAAIDFSEKSRELIENIGLKTLSKNDMIKIVDLWDPIKQRTAISSMVYYAQHVEKNSSLTLRLGKFLESKAISPLTDV